MLLVGSRKYLAYSFAGLVVLHFISAIAFYEFYFTCNNSPYQRSSNPDKHGTALIHMSARDLMFFVGIRFLLIYMSGRLVSIISVATARNRTDSPLASSQKKKNTNRNQPSILKRLTLSITVLAIIFGGYFVGLELMKTAKHATNDFECHGVQSNGVSGHTYFAVWALTLLVHISDMILQLEDTMDPVDTNTNNNNKPELVAEFIYVGFSVPSIRVMYPITVVFGSIFLFIQLFFTFWYGYHSIKQMVYGALFGVGWAFFTTTVMDLVVWKVPWSPFFQKGKHT